MENISDFVPYAWLGAMFLIIALGLALAAAAGAQSQKRPSDDEAGEAADRPADPNSERPDRFTPEMARRGKVAMAALSSGIIEGACHVIDGDTIRFGQTKIRLAGIDAPELDMPFGQKAKWAMVGLCKGHKIRAECTGEQSYDRLVATCYLPDGRDLGAELVKRGLALD